MQTLTPEEELTGDGSGDVVTLDDESAELTSAGDEILYDATISGASVTSTQAWDGTVTHSFNEGDFSEATDELDIDLAQLPDDDIEGEENGLDWIDVYAALRINIAVPEVATINYPIAEAIAGVTSVEEDGNGDGNGDTDGDDRNPSDGDNDSKPAPKTVEPLAETGTPLVGLIAAGGGAAAYLARRKKNTAAASEDGSES